MLQSHSHFAVIDVAVVVLLLWKKKFAIQIDNRRWNFKLYLPWNCFWSSHTYKKKLACYQLRSLWQKVIWPVDKKKSIMDITVINADKKNHLKNHLKSLKVFIENEWSWCRLRIHTHKCKYQRIGRSANNQTKITWTEIVEKQKNKNCWMNRSVCLYALAPARAHAYTQTTGICKPANHFWLVLNT